MTMWTRVALTFFILSGFSGCSSYRNAQPKPLEPALLEGINTSQAIAVINAQPSEEIVKVGSAGLGRSIDANYNQWTNAAVEILTKSLKKQGITTAGNSPKRLSLSIEQATLSGAGGGWAFTCNVRLRADTNEHDGLEFEGQRGSWKFIKACDAAITESVVVMLKDQRIRDFLND